MSFLRRPAATTEPAPEAPTPRSGATPRATGQKKGRPTPKRRDAVKRRTGPVGPPPKTQREALKRERAAAKDGRTGGRGGQERYALARDRGPVRAAVRDLVDSRRNVGTLFLPFAVLVLIGTVVPNPSVQQGTFSLWTAALLLLIIDSVRLGRHVLKSARAQFGEDLQGERGRSLVWYAITRSTILRRMRRPIPQVSPVPRR